MAKEYTTNGIPLPSWTDPAAVTSYVTSVVSAVIGMITLTHPGFHEPPVVIALIPSISLFIAGLAQIFNLVTHRTGNTAAIMAGAFRYEAPQMQVPQNLQDGSQVPLHARPPH